VREGGSELNKKRMTIRRTRDEDVDERGMGEIDGHFIGSFPGVKRQGREADHSPPTSAEVKKMWIYTFTPPYVFMA
jgi:hypothetical protein